MMLEIVTYNSGGSNPQVDGFIEALRDQNLRFIASDLQQTGFHQEDELEQAIDCAMKVCADQGLPLREHFKPIYIASETEHTLARDWQLSKLAYALVMLNGHHDNPFVEKLQLTLINRWFR